MILFRIYVLVMLYRVLHSSFLHPSCRWVRVNLRKFSLTYLLFLCVFSACDFFSRYTLYFMFSVFPYIFLFCSNDVSVFFFRAADWKIYQGKTDEWTKNLHPKQEIKIWKVTKKLRVAPLRVWSWLSDKRLKLAARGTGMWHCVHMQIVLSPSSS